MYKVQVALKATKPEKPTKTVNLHLDCKAGIATTKAHRAMNYGSYQHETGKLNYIMLLMTGSHP